MLVYVILYVCKEQLFKEVLEILRSLNEPESLKLCSMSLLS